MHEARSCWATAFPKKVKTTPVTWARLFARGPREAAKNLLRAPTVKMPAWFSLVTAPVARVTKTHGHQRSNAFV